MILLGLEGLNESTAGYSVDVFLSTCCFMLDRCALVELKVKTKMLNIFMSKIDLFHVVLINKLFYLLKAFYRNYRNGNKVFQVLWDHILLFNPQLF